MGWFPPTARERLDDKDSKNVNKLNFSKENLGREEFTNSF
jgi:hypothetical protein